MTEQLDLQHLYAQRFVAAARSRQEMWQALCHGFFQRYVERDAVVLDLAAGHCEFINNIESGRKIAIDINPAVKERANSDVETHVTGSDSMPAIADASVDIVWVSNFFEHISREKILSTLGEIHRVLKPTGRLLILQPNIRFCGRDYWMFFDHITPLDDRSLTEALRMSRFEPMETIVRFLPYTTKGRLPSAPTFVRLYLRVRPLWRLLGAQTFLVARPD